MKLWKLLNFILMTPSVFAIAAPTVEVRGVVFPAEIDFQRQSLQLNGYGLRQQTIFNVDVYAAALYAAERSSDADAMIHSQKPRRIDVVFLRDVEAKDLVKSWVDGFAKNRPSRALASELDAEKLRDLNEHMTDVKKGQRVSLIFANDALTLSTPGREPYTIAGREFAETVLATFIGVPPSEGLKRALLGARSANRESN